MYIHIYTYGHSCNNNKEQIMSCGGGHRGGIGGRRKGGSSVDAVFLNKVSKKKNNYIGVPGHFVKGSIFPYSYPVYYVS